MKMSALSSSTGFVLEDFNMFMSIINLEFSLHLMGRESAKLLSVAKIKDPTQSGPVQWHSG